MPSYSIYEVVPRLLATGVQTGYRFAGCVADSLTLELKEGGFLTAKVSWVGRAFQMGIAQTAAVYPANDELLPFTGARLYTGLGGFVYPYAEKSLAPDPGNVEPVVGVKDFSLTIKNNLDSEGFNLGGGGHRSRRPVLGKREVTGTITVEFEDASPQSWFANQISAPLTLNVMSPRNVEGTAPRGLNIYLPCVKFNGENPKSNGGSPGTLSMPFDVLDDESDLMYGPLSIWYATDDTAP
jgi:hypothetical protein